jgi:macrocin-O-methyltransferase TylF-like protien
MKEKPYWKGVQLALLGLRERGARFPAGEAYTLLEFGVAEGGSLERLCRYRDVLARRMRIRKRLTCVGFDTFEGLPDRRPEDVAAPWIPGDFASDIEKVRGRLSRFEKVELVQGLFSETLPVWIERLQREPPLFVSIDCDYYSSTVDVFEHLLPHCPTGCVFYFDDSAIHYWSDRAGEMQAVREVNEGRFGEHISLAEYPLWIETREIRHYKTLYRLLNLERGGFAIARPLTEAERAAGYSRFACHGIGVLSGLNGDPMDAVARPTALSARERRELQALELAIGDDYAALGRYIAVVARKRPA